MKPRFNKPLRPAAFPAKFKELPTDLGEAVARIHTKYDQALVILNSGIRHFDEQSNKSDEGEVKEMIKHNFIVTLMSEFEIYLKGLIRMTEWANAAGYSALLGGVSISLDDAYNMFVSGQVTREAIIAEHYSFQSMPQIDRVFNQLSGVNFLNEVAKAGTYGAANGKTESLDDLMRKAEISDWRKVLVTGYERRHKIVHEGLNELIVLTDVLELGLVVTNLATSITLYCHMTQNRKAIKK